MWCSLVPWRWNSSFQKLLMKMGSRSLTIERGIPYNRTMSQTNKSVTFLAENRWVSPPKWANLDSRLTTTRIVSTPFDFERPKTKSMDISSHTWVGIGNGCKRPIGDNASYLDFWHTHSEQHIVGHPSSYLAKINFLKPFWRYEKTPNGHLWLNHVVQTCETPEKSLSLWTYNLL